ncbi:hypothetical protein EDB19DRAFT_1903140 [Suillus lakei]|nr:hypothetical protein EDB19DRAFT_1903140 [Suillus lakei]
MEVVSKVINADSFILTTPLGKQRACLEMLQEAAEWAEVVLENQEDRFVEEGAEDLLMHSVHLRRWDGIPEEDLIIMHRVRTQGWAMPSTSAKDSGQSANVDNASLWEGGVVWGTGTGAKKPSMSGWEDGAAWGGNTVKPGSPEAKEPAASGWGPTNDWNSGVSVTMKSPGGRDALGTTDMMSLAQPKRNDADQENHRSKPPFVPPPPRPSRRGSRALDDEEDTRPLKMTGTNDVPMINTRWNKKPDATAPLRAELSERIRVPPLQTSALNNATPRDPPPPVSASRSEDNRMDVENWRRNSIPEKPRDQSPSLSTVTGSTTIRKRKQADSDLEKKQEMWKEFIRLCDRAVRAKKSNNYTRIGEAGRIRLDGRRTELEKVCAAHSDKLSQAISELAQVGDKLKSGIDHDQRYDIEVELKRYTAEVGSWISDIRPLLIANVTQRPPNTNHPIPHEDGSPRESPAIPDGLDPVRSRLDKQEELLEELQTTLTLGSSKNILATINNTIDKKIDGLRKARADAKAQRAKLPPPKVDMPPEATGAIEAVSHKATGLSAAMEAPVNDVAQLLIRQNNIQQTQASFKAENEELRESIAKLTETSAANRKLIQEQTEAIQRLKASLEAASESQRTPPPPAEPPVKVMFDELRAAVDVVLQDIVSRDILPKIYSLRDDCRTKNDRVHKELFELIWDKIEPCLKIAEAVNKWLWDDDKQPRRVKGGAFGCWRNDNDCFFVHPTEQEWDAAELSFPPPAHEVIDNDNEFRYELAGRHRRPSGSSVLDFHRDRPRYASPSKSPRAHRQDSRSDRRSRSPATSVAESDKLEKLRRDDGYHRRTSRAGSPSSYARHRSPPLDDRERRGHRARSPRRLSPPRPQISITKTVMPPPPPPSSHTPHSPQGTPPMRPPPPVPMPPHFLSLDISQKPPEKFRTLSADDLRKVWHERVDLLFASVKAREQLSSAEADLKLNKLGESSRMAGVSNARITAQTVSRCEAKKKDISDSIQKLTASEFWPALKPPDLQSVETKFFGLKQQILELKDSVGELSTSFSAFLILKNPGTASRREEEATAGPSEVTLSPSALDDIQGRLSGVENQLLDLQNDILQRNTIVEDEIDSRIVARLEEVDIFPDEDDLNPSSAAVTAAVQAETAKALDTINITGQQLGEVAQEENEQLKTEIAKLKSSAEADAKVVQQNNEQVEALAAALQAYISQAPPPPPQPVIPTHEYLMEELEDHILSGIIKAIEPTLRGMKDDVTKMLNEGNAALYQTLWPKLELVLRMVDTVKKGSNIILEPEE